MTTSECLFCLTSSDGSHLSQHRPDVLPLRSLATLVVERQIYALVLSPVDDGQTVAKPSNLSTVMSASLSFASPSAEVVLVRVLVLSELRLPGHAHFQFSSVCRQTFQTLAAVIAGVHSNCRAAVTFALIIVISNVSLQSVSSATLWL